MAVASEIFTADQLNELIILVKEIYDFDFSGYAKASLKRRIARVLLLKHFDFYDLKHALINDPRFFSNFMDEITVNVTEMFRDPSFYKALNTQVVPYLSSFPYIKVWSAGCSSGEEVYSLAILMEKHGLKNRSLIYGTDINSVMLKQAGKGIYNYQNVKTYAGNYNLAGLTGSLTEYFTTKYEAAVIRNELKKNTFFASHNLISDSVFNEFQLICCRNVFIYFEAGLQEKILGLFYDSLCPLGFLCLGTKENIRLEVSKEKFKKVDAKENIYQKIGL